jgi:AcrR family transcriptional regulator
VTVIGLRREPRQRRGERRVSRILDAAAHLFAEIGYEAATTNAIAARARTSIGSLYQFFPNKQAILQALSARYLEQLQELFDALLTPEVADLPLRDLLDRVIDMLGEFHAAHPGFQHVFYGSHNSPELAAAARDLHGEIVGWIAGLLALRAPAIEAERRRLHATVTVEVVKAMLTLSVTGDGAYRQAVIGETKALLAAYLGPLVGEASLPAGGAAGGSLPPR